MKGKYDQYKVQGYPRVTMIRPVFSPKFCRFCNRQFVTEYGYKIVERKYTGGFYSYQYSYSYCCGKCCPDKEDVDEILTRWKREVYEQGEKQKVLRLLNKERVYGMTVKNIVAVVENSNENIKFRKATVVDNTIVYKDISYEDCQYTEVLAILAEGDTLYITI